MRRIENEARKKATEVLTPEQREKLGQIPQEPIILAQLCRQMCPVKDKDAKKMSCCAAMKAEKQIDKAPVEQTLCPVMGGQINKNIFIEHQGKKVYFCCAECKGKFEAEPEKYISKLPQFQK